MDVIIHDLSENEFNSVTGNINNEKARIISDNGKIKHCKGCFECWIKTPGKCVINDGYQNIGEIFSRADKITIISKCCYGGYSPFVKNVLDRCISFLLPFFKIVGNEVHHSMRYEKKIRMEVHFYGENIDEEERDIADELVRANSVNLDAEEYSLSFYDSLEMMKNRIS